MKMKKKTHFIRKLSKAEAELKKKACISTNVLVDLLSRCNFMIDISAIDNNK